MPVHPADLGSKPSPHILLSLLFNFLSAVTRLVQMHSGAPLQLTCQVSPGGGGREEGLTRAPGDLSGSHWPASPAWMVTGVCRLKW